MKTQGRGEAAERGRGKHPAKAPPSSNTTPGVLAAVPPGRRGRSDDANAFMPDPEGGPALINDSLAENLAEEYLESATRGGDALEDALEAVVPEEIGGPFVETSAAEELADDVDASNPVGADREALPRPVAELVQDPRDSVEDPLQSGDDPEPE